MFTIGFVGEVAQDMEPVLIVATVFATMAEAARAGFVREWKLNDRNGFLDLGNYTGDPRTQAQLDAYTDVVQAIVDGVLVVDTHEKLGEVCRVRDIALFHGDGVGHGIRCEIVG